MKGEGKTVITLIPERRILLYVAAMIAGVVLATRLPVLSALQLLLLVGLVLLAVMMAWRGIIWRFQVILVCAAWGLSGLAAGSWQLARAPTTLEAGVTTDLDGVIERLDGRRDSRLRVWVRVAETSEAGDILKGHLVRLSVKPGLFTPDVGSHLRVRARIYPPPPRLLHGARDYALQARIRGVVASGYVVAVRRIGAVPDALPLSIQLARLRQHRADRIAGSMPAPAGGIAAALLIGDRRYVSEATYDLFRQSGLAHLLAISGLHMGLLCFGVIGFLRLLAALAPAQACRLPVHKIAALGGVGAGLGYVILSGLSVSAIRAFLMATLILAAWLMDRLGLTLRNVGLAAGAILLVNPMAVFGAGFQLSFAATTGLVIWFERWRHHARRQNGGGGGQRSQPVRWVGDLIMASLIATAATTPLTAQHFGTITPWGILANLAGIPLTGLWIMPSGLLVLVTQFLPVPTFIEVSALAVMGAGIDLLVKVAALFAELPVSPLRVTPPGAPLLVAFGICGLVVTCWRLPRRTKAAGALLTVAAAALFLGLRPGVDAVLLGGHRLVLAGLDDGATLYATGGAQHRALSSFHGDAALRALARHRVTPVAAPQRHVSQQRLKDGRKVMIVSSRRGLSRACRADGDLVLALVSADYPCRNGTPLVSLAALPPGNFLLRIGRDQVTARAADGQYFRINPVRRP